jgi:hypothetical protein
MRGAVPIAFALAVGACATTVRVPERRVSALPPPVAASSAPVEASSSASEVDEDEPEEEVAPPAPPPPPVASCNPQKPFEYLIRSSYIPVKIKKKEHEKALRWRTTQYGYVKGFGDASWNSTLAKDQAVSTTFFGLTVSVNKKIVPAIKCAETEIKATCAATPYAPSVLSGIRTKNTYRAGEVTNHLYGIALDIDPLLNSCCGCVKKWQANPLCKKKVKTIYERMAMPKCWVDAFEKYGFYWLGHDALMDTMHFEFLADPDQIMVTPSAPKVVAATTTPG